MFMSTGGMVEFKTKSILQIRKMAALVNHAIVFSIMILSACISHFSMHVFKFFALELFLIWEHLCFSIFWNYRTAKLCGYDFRRVAHPKNIVMEQKKETVRPAPYTGWFLDREKAFSFSQTLKQTMTGWQLILCSSQSLLKHMRLYD